MILHTYHCLRFTIYGFSASRYFITKTYSTHRRYHIRRESGLAMSHSENSCIEVVASDLSGRKSELVSFSYQALPIFHYFIHTKRLVNDQVVLLCIRVCREDVYFASNYNEGATDKDIFWQPLSIIKHMR